MKAPDTFRQRRPFASRRYTLVPGGIRVEDRRLFDRETFRIAFEDLASEPLELRAGHRGLMWTAVVAFGLAALMVVDLFVGSDPEPGAALFYAGFGVFFGALYLGSRATFTGFPAGASSLLFWKPRRPDPALEAFIQRVLDERARYLKRTYGAPSGGLVSIADELERLDALRQRGVLTAEEFGRLKADLIGDTRFGTIHLN